MSHVYLAMAIVAEVTATSMLKASQEFTRPLPSLIVVLGYGCAFYLLTLVLRTMPVGVAYALWSGFGILLVAIAGALFYKQVPDWPAVIGIALIISGIAVINFFSSTIRY
ncbi:MAG: multidrug efflux SMR transporter [Gammaproteobacteria bacterium]|jgi:small multidrug resistance pump